MADNTVSAAKKNLILGKAGMMTPADNTMEGVKENLFTDKVMPPPTRKLCDLAGKARARTTNTTNPEPTTTVTVSEGFGNKFMSSASSQPKPNQTVEKLNQQKITKGNFNSADQIYRQQRARVLGAFSALTINPLTVLEWNPNGCKMFQPSNILHFLAENLPPCLNLEMTEDEALNVFDGFTLDSFKSSGNLLTKMQQRAIIEQAQSLTYTCLDVDGDDGSDLVDWIFNLPGFKSSGLPALQHAFTSAQDIMRYMFDPTDDVSAVSLIHAMHRSWSIGYDDSTKIFELNGGYLGAVHHLLLSSALSSVLSPDAIRSRWAEIADRYDFSKVGGSLSDYITQLHEHLHNFALLVLKSDEVAVANMQHPSRLFDAGDHTGVNAILMLLGKDLVYGTNQVAWNTTWSELWKDCNTHGSIGSSSHY